MTEMKYFVIQALASFVSQFLILMRGLVDELFLFRNKIFTSIVINPSY
jgi:hypothetical protein